MNLCLMFDYRVDDPETRRRMMKSVIRYSDRFVWLEPPARNGEVTIADLLPITDMNALYQRSIEWARSIWDSWDAHHPVIRHWAGKVMRR